MTRTARSMMDTVERNCIAVGMLPPGGNAEMARLAAALPSGVAVLCWRPTRSEADEAEALNMSMPGVHVSKCGTGFAVCWRPPT